MTFIDIPQLPVDYIWISQGFSKSKPHYGIDIGYRSSDPNPVIKAVAYGEVAMKEKDQYGGLFVVLRHKNMIVGKWVYTCYWHLASFDSGYKVGDTVKRGQKLGIMGSTGKATGKHLHFEFWISPIDVKFSSKNRARDTVDPVEYIYAFDGQEISKNSPQVKRLESLKYKEVQVNGTLVQMKSGVRYRTEPSTRLGNLSVIDTLTVGEYTAISKTDVEIDGYKWVKIKYKNDTVWVALIDGYNVLNEQSSDPKDKEIAELKDKLQKTQASLDNYKTQVQSLQDQLNAAQSEISNLRTTIQTLQNKIAAAQKALS